MNPDQLLTIEKLNILKTFDESQRNYFKWFLALTEIPHGTNNCLELSQKIQKWCKELGYEPEVDKSNNIIVKIDKNSENESSKIVALQAHIDMVISGEIDNNKGINVEVTDIDNVKVLRAPKSTLGADDGFGVALMLEILETEKTFQHGPIELIFTTDEEDGLVGASELQHPPYLKFDYLINMDSLKGDKVYIGCCGGSIFELCFDFPYEPISKDDFLFLRINLQGLTGGHSGMRIGNGPGNSVKWLARILAFLTESNVPFRIVRIDSGSSIKNSIPTKFDVVIAVPNDMKDTALNAVHEIHTKIMFEYFRIEMTDFFTEYIQEDITTAASVESSRQFMDLLILLPNGVLRMSPDFPDTVQASSNISFCSAKNGSFVIHYYARSSCQSQIELFHTTLNALLRTFGHKYEKKIISSYPAWEPKKRSVLAKIVQNVYKEQTGEDIELGILQVGVEPSVIISLGYNDREFVSVCPSIPLAHAPGEWIGINEAIKWRNIIISTIGKINK